jgi:hypothetical protein
MDLRIVLFE